MQEREREREKDDESLPLLVKNNLSEQARNYYWKRFKSIFTPNFSFAANNNDEENSVLIDSEHPDPLTPVNYGKIALFTFGIVVSLAVISLILSEHYFRFPSRIFPFSTGVDVLDAIILALTTSVVITAAITGGTKAVNKFRTWYRKYKEVEEEKKQGREPLQLVKSNSNLATLATAKNTYFEPILKLLAEGDIIRARELNSQFTISRILNANTMDRIEV